jgi:hypothetical protein
VPGEEVTFCSGGCAIAGTFTEAADPVAAALLVPGGGKPDRNSDARLPGGRMLRIGVDKAIAGALAGARVCALRYDKRGVGASGGEYLRAGMDDRRADARAALGWLAARTGGLPLLAIGHSEVGVAVDHPDGNRRDLAVLGSQHDLTDWRQSRFGVARAGRRVAAAAAEVAPSLDQRDRQLPLLGQVDEHLVGISAGQPQLALERCQELLARDRPAARAGPPRVKRLQDGQLDQANTAALSHVTTS